MKDNSTEDMIVYWNKKGESYVEVRFPEGIDMTALIKIDGEINKLVQELFGEDKDGNSIIDNSSYEFSAEWS
jgi:hypothetical protein